MPLRVNGIVLCFTYRGIGDLVASKGCLFGSIGEYR